MSGRDAVTAVPIVSDQHLPHHRGCPISVANNQLWIRWHEALSPGMIGNGPELSLPASQSDADTTYFRQNIAGVIQVVIV
jgi:hypothetical protein